MFVKRFLILFVALLFLTACKDDSEIVKKSAKNKKIIIYTSVQPVAFISSKIAGRYAKVKALIPKGKSPHSFTLLASDLSAMTKAKFFFSVQLPFEKLQLEKVLKNSSTEWVDITKGIKFENITEQIVDSHIWLSPENDIILARNICDTLSKAMPQHIKYFELNFDNFKRCIVALDNKINKMLEPFKGEIFLVYHPAFGYFAKRYGLRQEAIELGGKSPTAKHLQKVISLSVKKKVRIIFVQPEFKRKAAKLIAKAIKGSVIKLDPLAYNLVNNYMTFATEIQKAMKREKKIKANEKK